MVNKVENLLMTGSWLTPTIARNTRKITLQARSAADSYYKFAKQDDFFTVKSGTKEEISGKFLPGDIEILAANGVVVEVSSQTYPE